MRGKPFWKAALLCGLIFFRGNSVSSALAAEGNATVTVQVSDITPALGQEVGFFLRYQDPDPVMAPVTFLIDFGDGNQAALFGTPAPCTSAVGWAFHEATATVPEPVRGVASAYHFKHTYAADGDFSIVARVQAIRDTCGVLPYEFDEASGEAVVSVGAS